MEEWNFSIKIWKVFRRHDEGWHLFADSTLLPELKKISNFKKVDQKKLLVADFLSAALGWFRKNIWSKDIDIQTLSQLKVSNSFS